MSVLVVRVAPTDVEPASDWIWRLGATAIEERQDGERVNLIVGFGDEDDDLALAARSILSERWPSRLESTGDEATWRDEWMRWIEPVQAGGFVVHAPWHDPALWSDWGGDLAELSIDPGRAFGSGHHATTRLVLAALRTTMQPGDSVLDVGCGTGILSIAAARLGAEQVLGIDLDYDIIEVADANVEANGVADRVSLRTDAVHELDATFDVVVANIVIGDLRPVMPAIVDRSDGVVIISGYLDDQLERLLGDVDITVTERTSLDEWGCAILRPTK